jgi:YrbI family 3-deoxy-D-manno-octulosonate 8-phosphate phosphatase
MAGERRRGRHGLAGGEKLSKPEILAIVPARGGSKGIPRKNIRLFAGYPLIAYSIAAGLQSETVTRVIVTTDDEEIAETARRFGAGTPFLRPPELAGDRTLDLPVFQHALTWLAEHEGYRPDVVVHLRPTTPLRPPNLVDRSVHILLEHPEADSVRAVTPAHQIPFKMWLVEDEDKPIRPLMTVPGIDEPYNAPRQILPHAYFHNGLIDIIRPATILEMNSMSGKTIMPVMFDPGYDIDLDTPNDWRRAEERIMRGGPLMVWPGKPRRPIPEKVELLVMDFDGVLTDNRVWVDQDGREMVAANRSDSLWLNLLREKGVQVLVLSKETNPVVAARCRKLNIPYVQGVDDKETALKKLLSERGVDRVYTVYCGNDVNDLPCFPLVGWAVAVADSVPEVARQADFVLSIAGGHGAVRELCEIILTSNRL